MQRKNTHKLKEKKKTHTDRHEKKGTEGKNNIYIDQQKSLTR